ncbi:MAG: DUF6600 domain-containing protein [Bacteroidota bacterium]
MRYLKMVALIVALNSYAWIIPQEASAQQGSVSFGVFYNELTPYGQWVDYPNYGYVWIPSAGPDFAPYSTNGHWIWTEYGWTWVSGYSWGWAPFHYGRWDYDDYYGWFWVPDYEWGPSWVNWRRADGYYGWAPMRPGISLSVSFGSGYTVPNDRWRFVRDKDFSRTDINHYYVNRTNNVTIIKNSSVINRTYIDQNRHSTYVSGPDRADVQKITGRSIQPVVIHDNATPGQNLRNGQLQIYRPQVQKNDENGRRPVPSKVVNLKEVKRPAERKTVNPIPNINPANNNRQKVQPARPTNITPAINNRQKVQPSRSVNTPNKVQPPQSRVVNLPNSQEKQKQPQNVASPNKGQPTRPRAIKPSNSMGKQKQPQNVAQPNKSQPSKRNANPSNNKGMEQQPHMVNPPKENRMAQPSQPKVNQDEKEKRKGER